MRRSHEGAQSILNLRTLHRNGEFEQYREDSAARGVLTSNFHVAHPFLVAFLHRESIIADRWGTEFSFYESAS